MFEIVHTEFEVDWMLCNLALWTILAVLFSETKALMFEIVHTEFEVD